MEWQKLLEPSYVDVTLTFNRNKISEWIFDPIPVRKSHWEYWLSLFGTFRLTINFLFILWIHFTVWFIVHINKILTFHGIFFSFKFYAILYENNTVDDSVVWRNFLKLLVSIDINFNFLNFILFNSNSYIKNVCMWLWVSKIIYFVCIQRIGSTQKLMGKSTFLNYCCCSRSFSVN